MSQTTLSVRMDSETKRGLEEFCAAVGMNTSTAINLFAKAVIREKRIPFEIALKGKPFSIADIDDTEEVYKKIAEAEQDIAEGRVVPAEVSMKRLREKYGL